MRRLVASALVGILIPVMLLSCLILWAICWIPGVAWMLAAVGSKVQLAVMRMWPRPLWLWAGRAS